MPVNPFTNYNSNQRVIAIPLVPTITSFNQASAVINADMGTITLSAASLANGNVNCYLYFGALNAALTAAASGAQVALQWQFRNAAHANVGGVTTLWVGSASCAGATATVANSEFFPHFPAFASLSIPATAVEITLVANVFAIVGAPTVYIHAGFGIDPLNSGRPGDIGGGGMAGQSNNSPNTF